MKLKHCLKVITKAEGLILFTLNFNVTDVICSQISNICIRKGTVMVTIERKKIGNNDFK